MKHLIVFVLPLCLALGLTGCRLNYMKPEEAHAFLDDIVSDIGDSQITDDGDMIGSRVLGEDSYTGSYTANCKNNTGRDIIFGGASIEERALKVYGTTTSESGTATVRIRLNGDVIKLETDDQGCFKTELRLSTGGNYIMVVYEDFSGSVELNCEYIEQDAQDDL